MQIKTIDGLETQLMGGPIRLQVCPMTMNTHGVMAAPVWKWTTKEVSPSKFNGH